MSLRKALLAIAAIILVWIVAAPFLCQSGTLLHLDGQVAQMDHGDLWGKQNFLVATIYGLGDILCHQVESRTFILNGNEMPFCVRDVSLLLGFIIGLALVIFFGMRRNRTTDTYIVCAFALIILDWAMQSICNSNVAATRVLTGLFAGAAVAMFLCFIADGLRNSKV